MNTAIATYAGRIGAGTPTNMFVNSGTNCTGALMGAANFCNQFRSGGMVVFRAYWPNAAARTMDPSGGCSFMCPGGNCFVRGADGLPVELLHFGVE